MDWAEELLNVTVLVPAVKVPALLQFPLRDIPRLLAFNAPAEIVIFPETFKELVNSLAVTFALLINRLGTGKVELILIV